MAKYSVVAVGRAYTDIVANVSSAFLDKNKIPSDGGQSFDVETLKAIQIELADSEMIAGGPSANSVAVISALGGKTGFFGKINNDDAGICFLEDFKHRGVEICCPVFDEEVGMSATCLVLLTPDGHRSFAYNAGCADQFKISDFRLFDFKQADFFLVEAHLLFSQTAASVIKEATKLAKQKTQIVINLQDIPDWQPYGEVAHFIADNADIIIGNESEHAAFSQIVSLPASHQQMIVTTRGKSGAEARLGSESYYSPAQRPAKLVSSVGAGDAFIAGFLLGLSEGRAIQNSLELGVRVATQMLGELGARPTSSLTHLLS